jgi:hypothetical protein
VATMLGSTPHFLATCPSSSSRVMDTEPLLDTPCSLLALPLPCPSIPSCAHLATHSHGSHGRLPCRSTAVAGAALPFSPPAMRSHNTTRSRCHALAHSSYRSAIITVPLGGKSPVCMARLTWATARQATAIH